MGSLYLTDLADRLYAAGLSIVEYGDWQYRSRSSGGYDDFPLCVMWHHTASGSSWDGEQDASYLAFGDEDAPLSNLYIDRSGTVWIIAGGATNTNGKGQSIAFSRGTVPNDSMNTRALGVEMGNNGVGELWPQVQIDSMFLVSNVCNDWFGNQPHDVSSHQFYAPDRKIDPATTNVEGPWIPSAVNSSGSWNRANIQNECVNRATGYVPPEPLPPEPTPEPPDTGDDFMASLPTIQYGDSGEYVARMQHLLACAGYMNEGNVQNYDGVWGDGTNGAKSRFDSDHGLGGSDTSCGSKSWESLMTGKVW